MKKMVVCFISILFSIFSLSAQDVGTTAIASSFADIDGIAIEGAELQAITGGHDVGLEEAVNLDFGTDYSQMAVEDFSEGNYGETVFHALQSTAELASDILLAQGAAKAIGAFIDAIAPLAKHMVAKEPGAETKQVVETAKSEANAIHDVGQKTVAKYAKDLGIDLSTLKDGLGTVEKGQAVFNVLNETLKADGVSAAERVKLLSNLYGGTGF